MLNRTLAAYWCVLTVLVFASCGSDDKIRTDPSTGKFNFSYMRYDSAAIEYRLDSVHNRGLVLQPLIMEAGNNNTAFQLIAYAYDTLNDYNNSWMPDTLRTITDSVPLNFQGRVIIGNSEINREQLLNVLRDDNGKRFSYDYVLVKPVIERVFNHLVYVFQPMKGNARAGTKLQMTSPFPPTRIWE